MVIKFVYSVFIGVLLATFVGVGIAAFYPTPKAPLYPTNLKYSLPVSTVETEATLSAQQRQQQQEFDSKMENFDKISKNYNRNVSVISLVAAVLILIASLTLFKAIMFIADGLILGGVLTLLYSIIRGFGTDDNMFRFVVVSAGLAISLILGYVKFIKPAN